MMNALFFKDIFAKNMNVSLYFHHLLEETERSFGKDEGRRRKGGPVTDSLSE